MFRFLARIICLAVAGVAGYFVYTNMQEIFENWIPLASGAFVLLFVFSIFYFPLMRPIADLLSDRFSVAIHRGRHIRSGSGLEEIPESPELHCAICGAPGASMCKACQAEIERESRTTHH